MGIWRYQEFRWVCISPFLTPQPWFHGCLSSSSAPAEPGTVTGGWEGSWCSPAQQISPLRNIFPQRLLAWRQSDLSSRPPWAGSKENHNRSLALSELGSSQPGSDCSLPVFLCFMGAFPAPSLAQPALPWPKALCLSSPQGAHPC